eukprot:4098314-Amphidinium_carterae.2
MRSVSIGRLLCIPLATCTNKGSVYRPIAQSGRPCSVVACVRTLLDCRTISATLLKRLGLSYSISGAWNVHLGRFIIFFSDYIQAVAWSYAGA